MVWIDRRHIAAETEGKHLPLKSVFHPPPVYRRPAALLTYLGVCGETDEHLVIGKGDAGAERRVV